MTENDIMHAVQLEASKLGARLFRNNVGLFTTLDGRKVRTGLCTGSSDLIGWYKGRFLAVEVKTRTGVVRKEQQAFIDQVVNDGGLGCIVREPGELTEYLTK